MAYYPTQLPDEVAAKPPRVWKGVVTLVIMALLVGAVTGIGVLEADNLHSVPISSSDAALTINVAGATGSPAATGPSPASSQSPDQPGRG